MGVHSLTDSPNKMSMTSILLSSFLDKTQLVSSLAIVLATIQDHPLVGLLLSVGVFGFTVWNRWYAALAKKHAADEAKQEARLKAAQAYKLELENELLEKKIREEK